MALRLMSGLTDRVATVLQDYLPAELDLIDAEEADGITTPDIAAGNYYQWDQQFIDAYPACSIIAVSSSPVEILMTGMGNRSDALHRLDLKFHITRAQGEEADMVALLYRYVCGAMRVLCILYPTLFTVADQNPFVTITTWAGEATYGPEEQQDDGAVVRTAVLPIVVRRIEAR